MTQPNYGKRARTNKKVTKRMNQVWVSFSTSPPEPLLRLLRTQVRPFLQRNKLLRTERLIVNLGSRLNQVLQVRPSQEVAQVHKLAVIRVLDVDNTPAVFATTDRPTFNDHVVLGADDSKGYNVLVT